MYYLYTRNFGFGFLRHSTSYIHVVVRACFDAQGSANASKTRMSKSDLALTTKSPGAILSVNPKGVNLMDEVNKKSLFFKNLN